MLSNESVGGQSDRDLIAHRERAGEEGVVTDVQVVERPAENGESGSAHVPADLSGPRCSGRR